MWLVLVVFGIVFAVVLGLGGLLLAGFGLLLAKARMASMKASEPPLK